MTEYMDRNMVKERDENSGQYTQSVPDGEILAYIREQGGVGTNDVAEHFDYERPSAYRRLKTLEDDDRIESRQIGNSLLWEARDRRVTSPNPSPVEQTRPAEPADTRREDVREHLRSALPGQGDLLETRVDTVVELYDLLREHEGEIVKTSELKALVDPDAVDYADVGSFWTNAVKKNKSQDRPNALTSLAGVEELGNGRYRYRESEV